MNLVGHEWLGVELGDWNRGRLPCPLGLDRGEGDAQLLNSSYEVGYCLQNVLYINNEFRIVWYGRP